MLRVQLLPSNRRTPLPAADKAATGNLCWPPSSSVDFWHSNSLEQPKATNFIRSWHRADHCALSYTAKKNLVFCSSLGLDTRNLVRKNRLPFFYILTRYEKNKTKISSLRWIKRVLRSVQHAGPTTVAGFSFQTSMVYNAQSKFEVQRPFPMCIDDAFCNQAVCLWSNLPPIWRLQLHITWQPTNGSSSITPVI